MIYRIKTNKDLFCKWKELEQETNSRLLSGLVQNGMFLPTVQLNESFDEFHQAYLKLQEKYTPQYLQKLTQLRDETVQYIKQLNNIPLTQDEFNEFSPWCNYFERTQQGFLGQPQSEIPQQHNCNHQHNAYNGQNNCSMQNCPLLKVSS